MSLLHRLLHGGPEPGSEWTGPKAICDDAAVGFAKAHYALTPDGKRLLLVRGRPVRLMQVDLAPGDPSDGSERYLVAAKDDPPQTTVDGSPVAEGSVVALEPEHVAGKTGVAAQQGTAAQIAEELRRRREKGDR